MWWSERRVFLGLSLGAALALAGCGFTPAYAPGGRAAALTGSIAVDAPRSDAEFALVRQLEARLGQPAAPRYRLSYDVELTRQGVGINQQRETTRYQLVGRVRFSVRDGAGNVVMSDFVSSLTGYAASGATTATLKATRDATDRLMILLADQIVTRLIASGVGAA